MESWFSTLKTELGERFDSHGHAKMALFDFIEVFDNQQRRHSALSYRSPAAYEEAARTGFGGVDSPMTNMNQTTLTTIQCLVDAEIALITDTALRDTLRTYLVIPERHDRVWEYAAEEARYPCWLIASCPQADWCIVYCEQGFGPSYPWGIVPVSNHRMGPDACWHLALEHAFRASPAWSGRNPKGYEVP